MKSEVPAWEWDLQAEAVSGGLGGEPWRALCSEVRVLRVGLLLGDLLGHELWPAASISCFTSSVEFTI